MIPVLVAISGGTCGGKSTVAKMIEDRLGKKNISAIVFAMDKYMDKEKKKVRGPFNGKEYPEHNHPSVIDFEKLYSDIHEIDTTKKYNVVIVEGLFALYDETIRKRSNIKLFVDLPSDERIYRRIKRGIEVWKQDLETVADRYLETVRHRHNELVEPTRWYADLVINGSNMNQIAVDSIAASIESMVRESK
jgi:uridine kinase